jgi:hypothetical protein
VRRGSRQWATALMGAALAMAGGSAQADEWAKAVRQYLNAGVKPTRACSQHTGTCTNAIRDGDHMMIALEDKNGGIAARLVCKFNPHRDRRSCVNFDTGERYLEVYAGGRWVEAR